jgi:hypothetical protein
LLVYALTRGVAALLALRAERRRRDQPPDPREDDDLVLAA